MVYMYMKELNKLPKLMNSLLEGEKDEIANLANASALIFDSVPDINWAGFYFLKGDELVLGPFQGKPACVHLKLGKGVCSRAVETGCTVVVDDVQHSYSTLKDRGVTFLSEPFRIRTGNAVEFEDPFGNRLGITDYR